MTLTDWIDKTGPKLIARKLKVDPSSVSNWRLGKAFPRPKKLIQIYNLSGGKITYEGMIKHFLKGRRVPIRRRK